MGVSRKQNEYTIETRHDRTPPKRERPRQRQTRRKPATQSYEATTRPVTRHASRAAERILHGGVWHASASRRNISGRVHRRACRCRLSRHVLTTARPPH